MPIMTSFEYDIHFDQLVVSLYKHVDIILYKEILLSYNSLFNLNLDAL